MNEITTRTVDFGLQHWKTIKAEVFADHLVSLHMAYETESLENEVYWLDDGVSAVVFFEPRERTPAVMLYNEFSESAQHDKTLYFVNKAYQRKR